MRGNYIWLALAVGLSLGFTPPARAQWFTMVHDFTNNPDGANPTQVAWTNGLFYGTTQGGGTYDYGDGTIFTFNTNGAVFSTVYMFTGAANNGTAPNDLLVVGNKIYGTTQSGGTNGRGIIYVVNTDGSGFTNLYSFQPPPDGNPSQAGLVMNGNVLYGTTIGGGGGNGGTIFKINTDGTGYGYVHLFTNNTSGGGYSPEGEMASGGNTLFGVAKYGGTNNNGVIYAVNTDGSGYTILHSFSGTPDGSFPAGGLLLNAGVLYGATTAGGSNNAGMIFAINTNGGGYTDLYSFSSPANNADGFSPSARLSLNGNLLYGTTFNGGAGGSGTVYEINTNGAGFAVIYTFATNVIATSDQVQSGVVRVGNSLWGTTSQGGSDGWDGSFFSVLLSPLITSQPQSISVSEGNPAVFTVGAADLSAIRYQWYFNTSTLLTGQTNSTLTLVNAGGGNAGAYTVVVADSFGSVTSTPANLTIGGLPTAPTITQQPQNYTVTNGFTASFTNVASGTAPLFYQWYFNTNTPVAGGTNAILVLTSVTTSQAGYYSVIVTNVAGSATSAAAKLTVIVSASPPTITQQPQNYTVTNGFTASFTNVASGTAPLFYHWYFNTNTPVAGGTNAILVLTSVTTSQAGYYSVIVTNVAGSATSAPAKLTVIVPASPPTITQQPQNYTVTNGFTASFTNVASGTAPLFYHWYFNTNTPVAGGTNAILVLAAVTTNQQGYYSVIVTNVAGSATSAPAKLTVVVPPTPPTITQQPQNYTVTNGFTASFTNVASGVGPLFYQWYFNTNTPVAGGTNSVLIIPLAGTNNAGYYSVIVSNAFGSVTSLPASLTVISTPPIIVDQPQNLTVIRSNTASFTLTAAGKNPLRYQWYSNNVATELFVVTHRLAGKTNANLSFTTLFTNTAYYYVIVTNTLGAVTSSPALLSVIAAPIILSNPQPASVFLGAPASFTVGVAGASLLKFQWYFNTNNVLTNALGKALAGATNDTLAFGAVSNSLVGLYTVIVTNTYGRATSSPVALSIQIAAGQPKFINVSFLRASSSFSFTVSNTASSANRLWASTNLTAASFWRVIASNVMAANGLWLFTDTNIVKTNQARFYRASSP